MKKRLRVLLAVLCALVITVMPAAPAWADPSSGEMTATEQQNLSLNDGKRINTFKLGSLYSYESLGNDANKTTLTLSTSTLQRIVKDQLLPQWSPLAASVFRDQAGQLVDLYGYESSGGNMSQAGFDAYFNMGKNGATTKYKDEVWSCYSLSSKLGQTHASHAGDPGWDQLTVSGVKQVNSLSGARNMVGQALYDCENHKGLRADEFLGVIEGSNGEERLDALNSDASTIGFANVVTSVNCKGSSADFDYVTFGIVFYDFEPVPVAANGLSYITGQFTSTPVDKGQQSSVVKNEQQQAIMHSALLGDSVTETTSTTLSGLASFKLSENIGANISWSETESESETEQSPGDDFFGPGSSTSSSSETTTMGLNWGAAWEMAGALGAEVGHSKSVQVSKAVETTIALPPHTYTTIDHSATATTYTQFYQQPAILNYKVAIFATSGDFYSGGSGGINSSMYDKQSLVIKFDTKDDATPFYGCVATDDLYSRVATNKDVPKYDTSGSRTYSTHSTASGWSKSEDINWASVMSTAQNYYDADVFNNVAKKNFFFESRGKLNVEQDKATSSAKEIYPLYDLASVTTSKTNYVLYSNNTLDYDAMAVKGYNKFGVPFYGFTQDLGGWYRCDENGVIVNEGTDKEGCILDDDPVIIEGETLKPKANTSGGTMYFFWKGNPNIKPKTSDHPDGQDLSNIKSPVVTVKVVNLGLNAPTVTAEGSYTGFYQNEINLNDYISWEVTDNTDKILETQVYWDSREPASWGINVKEGTGDVTFTKPGVYHVRPYVVNNGNEMVYPDWITVTATEHNFVHYDAKAPTCDTDGWIEHYRCSDCGKYFLEPDDSAEVKASDVIVEATGHNWGDWVTTQEASDDTPGKQQRVCKTDASHVEERNVYAVRFNMKEHGTAPASQTVVHGGSVTVPAEPKADGYTFEGWFTDAECTQPYNFGSTVETALADNPSATMTATGASTTYRGTLVLYAKWVPAKFTLATMAVGDVYVNENGEEVVSSAVHGKLGIDGVEPTTEDGYTYSYTEVECGQTVNLTVAPEANYALKEIQAIPFKADSSMGEPFKPTVTEGGTYSVTMPAADVAVVASFSHDKVTVTYDGNKPANASATLAGVPAAETIDYGKAPTQLNVSPTLTGYEFGGWFTDKDCTKPCLATAGLKEDTTLYAKWIKETAKHTVGYTLLYDPESEEDPGRYRESYIIAGDDSTAYDPTNDIYTVAGKDLSAAYALKQGANGACWFTDVACTKPYDFTAKVTTDLELYAQVVPRTYTVTYYDGDTEVGTQLVTYDTAIGELGIKAPTKKGYTLTGWTTNGRAWDFANDKVTNNLNLYADWTIGKYTVTFNANGHGTAPAAQQVTFGEKAQRPKNPTAAGYAFGGWYTNAACTSAYNFAAPVESNLTLYAKWASTSKEMYRLYNPYSGEHFYTSEASERDILRGLGWKYEGVGWYAPTSGANVYRLYNRYSGDHHFTTNAAEKDSCVAAGWTYEGVGWKSGGTKPVYREYNPYATSFYHNYTADLNEHKSLCSIGWKDEGVGWYGVDQSSLRSAKADSKGLTAATVASAF